MSWDIALLAFDCIWRSAYDEFDEWLKGCRLAVGVIRAVGRDEDYKLAVEADKRVESAALHGVAHHRLLSLKPDTTRVDESAILHAS